MENMQPTYEELLKKLNEVTKERDHLRLVLSNILDECNKARINIGK